MKLHMNMSWCCYYVLITVLSSIIDNIKTDFNIYLFVFFFFLNMSYNVYFDVDFHYLSGPGPNMLCSII